MYPFHKNTIIVTKNEYKEPRMDYRNDFLFSDSFVKDNFKKRFGDQRISIKDQMKRGRLQSLIKPPQYFDPNIPNDHNCGTLNNASKTFGDLIHKYNNPYLQQKSLYEMSSPMREEINKRYI